MTSGQVRWAGSEPTELPSPEPTPEKALHLQIDAVEDGGQDGPHSLVLMPHEDDVDDIDFVDEPNVDSRTDAGMLVDRDVAVFKPEVRGQNGVVSAQLGVHPPGGAQMLWRTKRGDLSLHVNSLSLHGSWQIS